MQQLLRTRTSEQPNPGSNPKSECRATWSLKLTFAATWLRFGLRLLGCVRGAAKYQHQQDDQPIAKCKRRVLEVLAGTGVAGYADGNVKTAQVHIRQRSPSNAFVTDLL